MEYYHQDGVTNEPKAYIQRKESLKCLEKQNYETIHGTRVIRCMYCGKEIEWLNSNNPDDYIHQTIPSKFAPDTLVGTCTICNALITKANRTFYDILSKPEEIEREISNLEELVQDLKTNKDKYATHYLQQKYQDEHLRYKTISHYKIYSEYSEEEKQAIQEKREKLIKESAKRNKLSYPIISKLTGRKKKNDTH